MALRRKGEEKNEHIEEIVLPNSLVIVSTVANMSGAQSIGSEPFGLNLFVPQYAFEGTMPMVASVMTAALTSAEYYVTCEECGLGPGATVTMAPGTYGIDIEYPGL